MPQHDWQQFGALRLCGGCRAMQALDPEQNEWRPPVSPNCPGDDDNRDAPRHRRPHPVRGGGGRARMRELEPA